MVVSYRQSLEAEVQFFLTLLIFSPNLSIRTKDTVELDQLPSSIALRGASIDGHDEEGLQVVSS
jgi:hypothetical protein